MFHKWLDNNKIEDYDLSTPLLPAANNRAFWDSKFRDGYVTVAEEYLDFSWPINKATDYIQYRHTGNRGLQERIAVNRRAALFSLVVGEIAEYKGRFLPDIVNGIFAISEETFWGQVSEMINTDGNLNYVIDGKSHLIPDADSGEIGLLTGETASLFAVIYYMLYDALAEYCPPILTRIEYELERRIITPYLNHYDFWWMGYKRERINNWNPWILSNLLTVFLLAEKRRDIQNRGISKMLHEIQKGYNSFCEDGGCEEGVNYWRVAGGMLFDFCEQLYLATDGRLNFFEEDKEKMRNIGMFACRSYIGNGYVVNYGDGSSKVAPLFASYLYRFGRRVGSLQMMSAARDVEKERLTNKKESFLTPVKGHWPLSFATISFMACYDELAALPDSVPEEIGRLEKLQTTYLRSGNWYYSAKAGSNWVPHNHNDVGNCIVYYENRPVLVDPGCKDYTAQSFNEGRYDIWVHQSSWHNLPEINEQMQMYGRKYRADSFELQGKQTMMSFAGAYPEEAGVLSLKRTVQVGDAFELADDFQFEAEENIVSENFITPLDVKIQGNKVLIGDRFLLESDVSAEILTDSVACENDNCLRDSWDGADINRVTFKFRTGKSFKVRFVLTK